MTLQVTNPWVRCQFSAVIPSPSRSAFPSLVGIEHLGLEACQGPGSRETSTDLRDTLSLPSFDHAWWWRRNAPSMSISILPATNLPNLRHFHLQFDVESFTKTTTSFPIFEWTSCTQKTLFPNCSNFPPVRWQCFSPPLPPPRGHREKPRSEAPGVWLATLKDCNSQHNHERRKKEHHKRS